MPVAVPSKAEALAEVIERVIKAALSPVVARVAEVESRLELVTVEGRAASGTIAGDVAGIKAFEGELRERVAVVETKLPLPGPAGAAGRDGLDGLTVEAFGVALEGDDRTLVFTLGAGEQQKAARVTVPWLLDRGVYRDGAAYTRGDVVTWAGSQWACREATQSRPGDGGAAWRLVVKGRGR